MTVYSYTFYRGWPLFCRTWPLYCIEGQYVLSKSDNDLYIEWATRIHTHLLPLNSRPVQTSLYCRGSQLPLPPTPLEGVTRQSHWEGHLATESNSTQHQWIIKVKKCYNNNQSCLGSLKLATGCTKSENVFFKGSKINSLSDPLTPANGIPSPLPRWLPQWPPSILEEICWNTSGSLNTPPLSYTSPPSMVSGWVYCAGM